MSGRGGTADAFELIGHPDRLSVVEALVEAKRSDGATELRFTDLRDRSDIDDTGRFNYHLDRLLGSFVTKTDEGYRLSSFGHRVLAPIVAGAYDPEWDADPIDTPGECPDCGAALRVRPDDTVLQLVCERDHVVNRGLLGYPQAVADRAPAAANAALGLLSAQGVELAVAGVCPTCHASVDGAIESTDADDCYWFRAPCETCGNRFANTVGGCVQTHPAVVSFLHDRGVDVRTAVPWSLPFVYPDRETVTATDPLRLSVDVEGDGDTLTVTVDRSATVVAAERTR